MSTFPCIAIINIRERTLFKGNSEKGEKQMKNNKSVSNVAEEVPTSDFLMKPKVDFAFKEIMMNENARVGFLSAILSLNPNDVKETQILNTNLRKLHEDDKQGILDVRILLNNQVEIDIEIQLAELKVWADRSLFYLAKMYVEQIEAGDTYKVFKRCVSISVLNFTLFQDTKEFYSCFHLREDKRNTIYTEKMEFHVLELTKLPKELKEDSSDILTESNKSPSEGSESIKWEEGTYLCQMEFKRHLTSYNSSYSVMRKEQSGFRISA